MNGTAGRVSVERIRVGDLPALAPRATEDQEPGTLVPITRERALAQAANPAATGSDIGLVLARLEGKPIGYLGLVPVGTTGPAGHGRASFLSTYYVAPEHRNTGAGTLLMLEALALGVDLFVAGFADVTRKVCLALGFREVGPVETLCLRLDAGTGLPILLERARDRWRGGPAARALALSRKLSRATVEPVLRRALVGTLHAGLGVTGRPVSFVPVERVATPAGARPLTTPEAGTRFVRGDAIVNWMIQHLWLSEGDRPVTGYAFTSCRRRFRFLPFALREGGSGSDLGYVVLRLSDDGRSTDLSVLDAVYTEPDLAAHAIVLALREARRHGVDRIVCGTEYTAVLQRSRLLRLLTRRETRGTLYRSAGARAGGGAPASRILPGFCDGDAPYV